MPNSATLLQALGAAFCAILCAFHFSALGGGGMMIGARTAAWAKSGAPLPYDAEVEWLKGDGESYIDIGFRLTSDDSIYLTAVLNRSESFIFGCRDSASSKNISIGRGTDPRLYCDLNSSNYNLFRASSRAESSGMTNFILSKELRQISGANNAISNTYCDDVFETSQDAFLFWCAGSPYYTNKSKDSVISLKIDRGLVVKLDMIPVSFTNENGDDEGAMYNRLGVGGMNPDGSPRNDGLFRNRGTGAFIIGPVKT